VQIKIEYGQLHEIAAAFGVRLLGTALVVISGFYIIPRKETQWISFHHCRRIEVDYQSGSKQPHSKGSADMIYAHASVKLNGAGVGCSDLTQRPQIWRN